MNKNTIPAAKKIIVAALAALSLAVGLSAIVPDVRVGG